MRKKRMWGRHLFGSFLTVMMAAALSIQAAAAYRCTRPEDDGNERESGTFTEDERGRRFVGSDGQTYVDHWLLEARGGWYYFDAEGYAVTGWQVVEGKQRYFTEKGRMKIGYFVWEGNLYHTESTGELTTSANYGKVQHVKDGVPYYFDAEGKAYNSEGLWDTETQQQLAQYQEIPTWVKEGEEWVYYQNGEKIINGWLSENRRWYYFDENGYLVTKEVREIDGVKYSFGNQGEMETRGTAKDADGIRYRIQENGVLEPIDEAALEAKKRLSNDYALNTRQQWLNKNYNPYNENQTVQWFNATYAILTKSNGQNIRAVGGFLPAEGVEGNPPDSAAFDEERKQDIRNMLVTSWGVYDRASADAVLEALIQSGNETGSAWDYSRAMSNLGFYYWADYYTIGETLDKSLEVAKIIQTRFQSWDEFTESYLAGYAAWSGNDPSSRREIYEKLKTSAFNPYALDWNMELTKNW